MAENEIVAKTALIADWKRVREQIVHEDTLVNYRTTAMLAVNGFLFTAFSVLLGVFKIDTSHPSPETMTLPGPLRWIFVILPLIGIVVSYVSWRTIIAALTQVGVVRAWWEKRLQDSGDDPRHHPRLIGPVENPDRFFISHGVPWILLLSWMAVAFVAVRFALA